MLGVILFFDALVMAWIILVRLGAADMDNIVYSNTAQENQSLTKIYQMEHNIINHPDLQTDIKSNSAECPNASSFQQLEHQHQLNTKIDQDDEINVIQCTSCVTNDIMNAIAIAAMYYVLAYTFNCLPSFN